MDHFNFRNSRLHAEDVSISDIVEAVGTPCFVYSRATLERHWHAFDRAFGNYPHRIHYAVKANSNLAVLNVLARLGSGFDIVSGGELARVIRAGGDPAQTIFSGVCKQDWEITEALQSGVGAFNIESEGELESISGIATRLNARAAISVRINPDVDARTHAYISTGLKQNKFGLSEERAMDIYLRAREMPGILIRGIACHIGSQITELAPYRDALEKILNFVERLAGHAIEVKEIDFGGGLGVRYNDESPPAPEEYARQITEQMRSRGLAIPVAIEPGRGIAGNAGILVTRVHSLKHNEQSAFCIVDAAMNDLIRPALYQAYHEIVGVAENEGGEQNRYDVVGPVCESADFIGKDRDLAVCPGDLLAVRTVGAYGFVLGSNYNSRSRPPEVMVDGNQFHVVRDREDLSALMQGERTLP
ncbi:MAG: diaminopimelate decarboxylase [Gammaproteobacteria bacterium]|nr:diaminopimelate decarboxylase [Gammaproteobacteria bacterium]